MYHLIYLYSTIILKYDKNVKYFHWAFMETLITFSWK